MKRHTIGEWLFALRLWSLPASAMPVIATVAFMFWKDMEINWLFALLALAGMLLFHCTGNVWSDYFDFKKKVDAEDTFGAKTLTTGMFRPEEIKRLAIVLLILSVICGLCILALTGLPVLWIGLAGAVLTLLYPFLKFNALGDLDILLNFAFLPTLGTCYVAGGVIDWSMLLIALPVGLITDGILHSNNTRDMLTDKRAGIKTMAMSMGTKASCWLYGFEMVFPYVWIAALSLAGLMPVYTVVVFLTLPVAIGNAKSMMKVQTAGSGIIADLDAKTAQLQLFFSLLLSASLVFSAVI